MKDLLTDANFPRTGDGRVYHLGLRPGEVSNRILTVGSTSRAHIVASHLDATPKPFVLTSERGFLTITGRYSGVPVSIVVSNMGTPNMDFTVRELRECLSGDMLIVRLGSCGGLVPIPVGSVVVPKACVAITRNVDFDFNDPDNNDEPAYRISKPVSADDELHEKICEALERAKPKGSTTTILSGLVNASADSFYSSQGRQTSFPDCNAHLLDLLLSSTPGVASLEMETHHLYHLAKCWGRPKKVTTPPPPAPLTAGPVEGHVLQGSASTADVHPSERKVLAKSRLSIASLDTRIRAAAAQLVFASRTSQDFITPEQVHEAELWTSKVIDNPCLRRFRVYMAVSS
ncbi:uridine phosphorylase [Fistulina hepatica ATCC 64428]|uniref:Uridine phosphorylase n=1 Tax=Fistulina hepatica ATCC 64428 TaxID=1128425 RepID=A0A0D7AQP8_9AGAR|nr:uridine phosphorylase [Fistulina hepatica ATCC 64428]